MRPEQTEQIVNRAPGFRIMNRGVMRAKRQQTDQGKNDQEKTKDADDFLAHKIVSGCVLRVTGCELRDSGVRYLSVV